MLSSFPLCIKGWLAVSDIKDDDIHFGDWKSSSHLPTLRWSSKFCILMENDQKLFLYDDEPTLHDRMIPDHIVQCRLDEQNTNYNSDSYSHIDEVSTTSSRNQDSDRYASNNSLTQFGNLSRPFSKGSFFRSGSRLFRRAKSSNKINTCGKESNLEAIQPTKSVSTLKRSQSLSRLNRKKSEEKSDSKSPQNSINSNQHITYSTGDLTQPGFACFIEHDLTKDTSISDVHTSLAGGRSNCFSITSPALDHEECGLDHKQNNFVSTTRFFVAKSSLEKQCWMKRIAQTLKPNMENESRVNNSLRLTIFECKCLQNQKRRFFCEISLDKSLYARTTSKLSNDEGNVFWAEDLMFRGLPVFKTLTISVYKEPEPVKDAKKKKKKHHNQCIGFVTFNLSSLIAKNEFQAWFPLKTSDIFPDISNNVNPQLRVKIRYQSLKVLKVESYSKLEKVVCEHYIDLIQSLENILPIKVKEEVANCMVNIHEKNGTIIEFLTNLITEEITDLDNCSMTLRANTTITKIIECHMKLVGSNYLNNMLNSLIVKVMFKNQTVEVDPTKLDIQIDGKDKTILDHQHTLTEYLKEIWRKIFDSRYDDFPKQLRTIFAGWRNKLESKFENVEDRLKIHNHCDLIVSGCIFLRLICPAILSPHLFGLVSHFSEKNSVNRTLTLIAKSLQSLANLSKFGDKERFMLFLNSLFDNEIPRMHEFLRDISSINSAEEKLEVDKEIHLYGASIDLPVELARLHSCLNSDSIKDNILKLPKVQSLMKLPDILREIEQYIEVTYSQQTHSLFSNKKPHVPPTTSDVRRTSLGTNLNSKTQDQMKSDYDSPPRLGSPVCPSMAIDSVAEYVEHSDDIWQLRPDANCSLQNKVTKNSVATSIIYSNKQQYNISPFNRSQMVIPPSTHRGHYNTQENVNKKSPYQSNLSKVTSSQKYIPCKKSAIGNIETQPKKSSIKPYDNHYSRVHDSLIFESERRRGKNTTFNKTDMDLSDKDFYKENPLYGFIDSTRSTPDSERYTSNSVERFFSVRSQVSKLEQRLRSGDTQFTDSHPSCLQDLYQELEFRKKEVQNDQLKDLTELKKLVESKNWNPSVPKNGADVLDDVINSINVDGAGLEEVQQNLRRRHMVNGRSLGQLQSANTATGGQSVAVRPRQGSLSAVTIPSQKVIQTVDISESQSTSQSSLSVKSPSSSSNCSSIVSSGMI